METTTKKVTPIKRGDSIVIIGKRWFDKRRGSTYHSATCLANGKEVAYVPFAYGYGDQYIYTGANELAKLGYLADFTTDTVFWRYCDDLGIVLHCTSADVATKKDL